MSQNGAYVEKADTVPAPLIPNDLDWRDLVRLIQCVQCSRPLRQPVTLPCGNAVCRQCLPQSHQRENISYPDLPGRRQAIQCPIPACGLDHPTSDCNVDVTLTKVMDIIATVMAEMNSLHDTTGTSDQAMACRLLAAYLLASQGHLLYSADLEYQSDTSIDASGLSSLDRKLIYNLLLAIQRETECHVCYSTMLDPVTTYCGHTLCRNCLVRVLDHSLHCPVCRTSVATERTLREQPSNRVLVALLDRLCPDLVAARKEAVAQEERIGPGTTDVPLFVCTIAFPNQPTFLNIFEPRYKLMIRRCLEGNRQFGMLLYNKYSIPQGDLGAVHFYHYGTMLEILQAQPHDHGQILLETRGLYRFRVKSHAMQDGYLIGDIERLDDVSLAEEERIEAEETSAPQGDNETLEEQISRMSTQALLDMGNAFMQRMQLQPHATWVRVSMNRMAGPQPQDPFNFPYWFASVLPVIDEEKYKLLGTRTVRERLKITAGWIKRIESQRWYQNSACRIL